MGREALIALHPGKGNAGFGEMPPAGDFVRALREWHLVEVDSDLVSAALSLAEREEMSPWDAAVLEAARRADCTWVLSESLPAGRTYEGVRVENPFV